jgi:hypothetical protein
MCPDIYSFIMDKKQAFENLPIRIKVDSISIMKFVILHELWTFMERSNVRLVAILTAF